MKLPLVLLAGLLLAAPVFGQASQEEIAEAARERNVLRINRGDSERPELTRFDLDFPGGTPAQLVAAIEQATGRPLNAIIPPEHADRQLPPVRMNQVTVAEFFEALQKAGEKVTTVARRGVEMGYPTRIGFSYAAGRSRDEGIWVFSVVEPPPPPPKPVRYFLLTPYLQQGLSVDDITTAIQTGWRMRGEAGQAEISFHQETKLLIAVGEAEQLQVIDAVLAALGTPAPPPPATTALPAPTPPPAPAAPKS